MEQPPEISVEDYSERSVVIRSQPDRFLQSYSGHLVSATCKWNSNLRSPTGQSTLGGWICPKKNEQSVRSIIQQILSGQLAPMTSQQFYQQSTTPQYNVSQSPTMRPSPNMLASMLGQMSVAEQQSPLRLAPPLTSIVQPRNILVPLPGLPGGIEADYQPFMIKVLRPRTGQIIHLTVGEQKIPITVESVQEEGSTVISAIVLLPDNQRTQIQLSREEARWLIPGFSQSHTITL